MINFENNEFFYEPFPHCVLNQFLNPSFYEELCNEFPEDNYMVKLESKKNDEERFNKFRLDSKVDKINFKKFINNHKAVKNFYEFIQSDDFLDKLLFFFNKNYINLNIQKNSINPIKFLFNKLQKKNLSFDFEFSSISVPNGFVVPHTDGRNKILGFVIPIIDDEEILKFDNLGTKILKAKNNKYKYNHENRMVPFEETEEVRILPFKKNIMNIHVKTFNSLHGVGPFKENDYSSIMRKSISMFLIQG
jgi:hypothetical protein|tara:strand:- start:2931 stop:3674 length:744 start_codon:yes stop_codon:yes gene_type:complete